MDNTRNGKENGSKTAAFAAKHFLFVSLESLSGDLAWQIKKEGHEVRVFIEAESDQDVYDGFLEKVDDWEDHIEWADVIVFDDVGFGEISDILRKEGKLVIGGSEYTDKLEEDREFGQHEMREVDMQVLPHWDFTDFQEAVDFIKENPGRYVFKPSGSIASDSKGILFMSQDEDGKDLVEILEQNKKLWAKKIKKFQLQKMAVGVEIAVGTFFNGEDFIYPLNVNFEHKKLFPGDIGPYTGEMGCYDEETEVLTKAGWKYFRDVSYADEFLTVNKEGVIEHQKPTNIVRFNHHKKLLSVQNNGLDLKVTLDHNMYGIEANKFRQGSRNFDFVKARDLPSQFVAPRTGMWIGTELKTFILPGITMLHYEGKQVMAQLTKPMTIQGDDWVAFMGIFLSEGCTSSSYCVSIAQKITSKTAKIAELLSRMPFNFSKSSNSFYCYNKQLHAYLEQFGKAGDKFVPSFIKELTPRQIKIFLDWYCLGNGHIAKNNYRIFYTKSKIMADDTQELLLKIGNVGLIKERQPRGKVCIVDHYAESNSVQYDVIEKVEKKFAWIDKRDSVIEEYDGLVYCVTIPNHTLYVRRNGKPVFCGNTLMFWADKSIVFDETLFKLKDKLAKSGYVGYIDINCIANGKGIYPLEVTARFGYPTLSIHMEGTLSKWGDFLYGLAKKEKPEFRTKRGFQVGVVIAVPPFPFDDKREAFIYKDLSILFKKPNTEGIHLGDVKMINGVWTLAGESGYALVVTGSGSTVEEARNQAYSRIKNIILQNMFYRTDIGMKWYKESDKLHTWGYW